MPSFSVLTTPHFDRLFKTLVKRHPDLLDRFDEALQILKTDPYNRSHAHHIKKREGIRPGEGQYRLTLRRWRFRYDLYGQEVALHYCGLRREDTYR
ncbi:MAG: hypothetical protein EXS64_06640 [Candidatus Latescibacteria bacterium]|nr:hypothetical protein [Candidatus Latescibacterota bacterium]